MNMEDTKQDIDIKVEMEEEVKTKRCPKCERVLPITQFSNDKSKKDGLRSYCKECTKAYNVEYYVNNKERLKAYSAEWRVKNKEAISQKKADYRVKNKEKIAQKNAEWRAKHPNYDSERRDPILSPLGWCCNLASAYRSMDKQRGFDDSKTVSGQWLLDNIVYQPCVYCGKQGIGKVGANRIDNSKGHTQDNVEPCCPSCNSSLGNKYAIARGLHVSCKHKKQSFKEFVKEHKKR